MRCLESFLSLIAALNQTSCRGRDGWFNFQLLRFNPHTPISFELSEKELLRKPFYMSIVVLLSVFGTPSALMYGGLNVVRNLTEVGLGTHKLINANNVSDLREAFSGPNLNENAKIVFYSDLPNAELCALFIKIGAPMVLFLDNFDDIVTYISASREMSLPESVRLASRSICALEAVIRSDLVLKIDSRAYHRRLVDVIGDIGEFFKARLKPEDVTRIAMTLGVRNSGPFYLSDYLFRTDPKALSPGKGIERLAVEERRLVDTLAQGYSAIAAGRSFTRMDWPISMLIDSNPSGEVFSGRIELLGPARFLAYGPYLHLTPGRWRADIEFEISDNLSGNQLYVDAYAGDILCVVTAHLPADGNYMFQISFTITDPLEPVQLRFQSLSGAIEGVINLDRIGLSLVEIT